MTSKFIVGNEIVIAHKYRSFGVAMRRIVKVGHKRAYIGDNGSWINMHTMDVYDSSGSTFARAYFSMADYELQKAKDAAWTELKRALERKWYPPDDTTTDRILEARKLLGV